MRLFIALEFNDKTKDNICNLQAKLKSNGIYGNYSLRQNLHMTLAFIGEVDAKTQKLIINAIKDIQYHKFDMQINSFGSFSKVLYLNVKDGKNAIEIANIVREKLDVCGVEYDKKQFKPHITILREQSIPANIKLESFNNSFPIEINNIEKVVLYESTRINGKLTYLEKYSIKLR